MSAKFAPREGDLPREELASRAEQVVQESRVPVDVLFKFTCEHCGERCTLQEPNKLYESGECFSCGKKTEIKFGGYSLHFKFGEARQQQKN